MDYTHYARLTSEEAEDDMDCVVIDGKDRDEIDMDDADAHWEAMDDIEREEWMRGDEDEKMERKI